MIVFRSAALAPRASDPITVRQIKPIDKNDFMGGKPQRGGALRTRRELQFPSIGSLSWARALARAVWNSDAIAANRARKRAGPQKLFRLRGRGRFRQRVVRLERGDDRSTRRRVI